MEFRPLFLYSLQYSSKAESPKNRPAKQSSVGTLLLETHSLFFCIFLNFFIYRVQALLLICITVAIGGNGIGLNKKHYYYYQNPKIVSIVPVHKQFLFKIIIYMLLKMLFINDSLVGENLQKVAKC